MKKGVEWFEFLSDEEKQRFTINVNKNARFNDYFEWMMEEIYINFSSFIGGAFDWNADPDFPWFEVAMRKVK